MKIVLILIEKLNRVIRKNWEDENLTKFCKECGNENKDTAVFCENCGRTF